MACFRVRPGERCDTRGESQLHAFSCGSKTVSIPIPEVASQSNTCKRVAMQFHVMHMLAPADLTTLHETSMTRSPDLWGTASSEHDVCMCVPCPTRIANMITQLLHVSRDACASVLTKLCCGGDMRCPHPVNALVHRKLFF